MNELAQILSDAIEWASDPANVNTDDMYSPWSTHQALMDDLKAHHSDALNGYADFGKLALLFAPTACLCEVATQKGVPTYLLLSSRFDEWFDARRPTNS